MKLASALLSLVLFAAGSAQATDHLDLTDLKVRLESYADDLMNKRFHEANEAIPPRVLQVLAEDASKTVEEILFEITARDIEALGLADIQKVWFEDDEIDRGTAPNGREYAFLFLYTNVEQDNGILDFSDDVLLALIHGETWHVMRLTSPDDYALVQAAYPGLSSVPSPFAGAPLQ